MADEGFRIEGVVELVADEKSIDAIADDADRSLARRPTGPGGKKTSPVAPRAGIGRDALAGASGAAFAKQVGGEVGKVQEKAVRGAGGISPVTAGIIGGKIAKGRADPSRAISGGGRGFQKGVVAAAAAGNLKGGLLSILKSPTFLAATAVVGGAVIAASLPKLIAGLASKRLDRLVGLPGAEFSPELSALALQRTIRQRFRTQQVGRIRGRSATALAQTADEALDKLARIGAVVGVGLDKLLRFIIDRIDPFLNLIENFLRWQFPNFFIGTSPGSLNLPVNLLFGTLRARAFNPVPPIPVRP